MRPNDPHDGPSRRRRSLRPRWNPSNGKVLSSTSTAAISSAQAVPAASNTSAEYQRFAWFLYPPGTPQPTPAEIRRESFTLKPWASTRSARPVQHPVSDDPRLRQAGDEQSVAKSHFQYALFMPSNSSNPIYGEFHMLPGNMLQSGSNLILEMQGPTGTEVNGLPTRPTGSARCRAVRPTPVPASRCRPTITSPRITSTARGCRPLHSRARQAAPPRRASPTGPWGSASSRSSTRPIATRSPARSARAR